MAKKIQILMMIFCLGIWLVKRCGIYALIINSGRGAAWLAHQSGGLGVGGSNPLAPIILFHDYFFNFVGSGAGTHNPSPPQTSW